MTEKEWLECAVPGEMLQFLRDKAFGRKLRLFACAAARGIWRYFPGERTRLVVAVSEQYADGLATKAELKMARKKASRCEYYTTANNAFDSATQTALWAAYDVERLTLEMPIEEAIINAYPIKSPSGNRLAQEVRIHQCALLRDIFSPFRSVPLPFDPAWLTSTVTQLAHTVYHERFFERLPILADALEEGGYTGRELLEHLRSGGEHVRGCWALDELLGKS